MSEPSEAPTLVRGPVEAGDPTFGRLAGPTWSDEDRWLKLALKIGLVLSVLCLEAIVVTVIALVMWRATQAI